MSFFNKNQGYDTQSVRETLDHVSKPKITQTTVYSMEPEGLYGTVYDDPRGLGILRISAIVFFLIGLALVLIFGIALYQKVAADSVVPDSILTLDDQTTLNLPILSSYVNLDDTTIYDSMSGSYTLYQTAADTAGMTFVKLPDNIDAATMAIYYAEGLNNLETDEIASVLRTSWIFSTSRSSAQAFKVKYADFASGSVDGAISAAMTQQGFDGTTVLSSGTDTSGNTYTYGSVAISGITYYWRVSSCVLSDVYTNENLPSDAAYVVITFSDGTLMDVDSDVTAS